MLESTKVPKLALAYDDLCNKIALILAIRLICQPTVFFLFQQLPLLAVPHLPLEK